MSSVSDTATIRVIIFKHVCAIFHFLISPTSICYFYTNEESKKKWAFFLIYQVECYCRKYVVIHVCVLIRESIIFPIKRAFKRSFQLLSEVMSLSLVFMKLYFHFFLKLFVLLVLYKPRFVPLWLHPRADTETNYNGFEMWL